MKNKLTLDKMNKILLYCDSIQDFSDKYLKVYLYHQDYWLREFILIREKWEYSGDYDDYNDTMKRRIKHILNILNEEEPNNETLEKKIKWKNISKN